ncbi:hypothetical protein V8G54_004625 [Vigna mungo]|uniref:WRKY domain-containing protein n=1 Tax=Vigna mungo TaxID=3915 RepID=A0AAQ3PC28_VIGMU
MHKNIYSFTEKLTTTALHCRGYYRCTHKHTRGCRATKQIQRLDEDPTTIEVTYIGIHSCTQKLDLRAESGDAEVLVAESRDAKVLVAESGDAEVLEDFWGKANSVSSSNKSSITVLEGISAEPQELQMSLPLEDDLDLSV